MRKTFCSVVALGLLAACGDDPKGVGGTGGSGGGAPVELPPETVMVQSEAGRTFESERVRITVREMAGGAIPEISGFFQATEMETGTDYDVQFRLSREQLETGVANPNLSGRAPTQIGMGKIEVDGPDGWIISDGLTDRLDIEFSEGFFSGTVTSPEPEMAATIEGGYDLRCEILEGGKHVEDADFASDVCQQFAHQRPRTE
ncbi:hypothetical protein [Vulgatibacter sp.]|uniref:hypothetical protein n=1 Tax=Vulgatibacter sp. TaxID=1971226 RepID=UPI003569F9CA